MQSHLISTEICFKNSRQISFRRLCAQSSPSVDSGALSSSRTTTSSEDRFLYQAQLGSLMYLSVWAGPDLSERCSRLGQFAHNLGLDHSSSLCRVFLYLKGTTDLLLKYQAPNLNVGIKIHSLGFSGYTDAAYADNIKDLKSTFRYKFKLIGGPIS